MDWLNLFDVMSEPSLYSSGSNNEPRSHFFGKAVFFVVFISGIAWFTYEVRLAEKIPLFIPSIFAGLVLGFLAMMLSYRFGLLEFRKKRDYIIVFAPMIVFTIAACQFLYRVIWL